MVTCGMCVQMSVHALCCMKLEHGAGWHASSVGPLNCNVFTFVRHFAAVASLQLGNCAAAAGCASHRCCWCGWRVCAIAVNVTPLIRDTHISCGICAIR